MSVKQEGLQREYKTANLWSRSGDFGGGGVCGPEMLAGMVGLSLQAQLQVQGRVHDASSNPSWAVPTSYTRCGLASCLKGLPADKADKSRAAVASAKIIF